MTDLLHSPHFPQTIDINITAKRQLQCNFCWGPDHKLPNAMDTRAWKGLLRFFFRNGTRNVVFTGGEPLLRKGVSKLLRYAFNLGFNTTLSTNTILLPELADQVLPFVHQIGIPLDGGSKKSNAKMRLGRIDNFDSFFSSLRILEQNYPEIEVTVRTVVSKVNYQDIASMGSILSAYSGAFHRWKIYEFSPFSYGEQFREEHEVPSAIFRSVSEEIQNRFSFLNPVFYPRGNRKGRYVFVDPMGNIYSVSGDDTYTESFNYLNSTTGEILDKVSHMVTGENWRHASSNPIHLL